MRRLNALKLGSTSYIFHLLLNISAAWYLASYLTFSGVVSTIPLVIVALTALLPFLSRNYRSRFLALQSTDKLWIWSLALFGAWSALAVWYHGGESFRYETPAKFILGAVVATTLGLYRINLQWVKAGVIAGCLLLLVLVVQKYDGQQRFSPLMNATKWGNAIALQTILCVSLAVLADKKREIALFLLLASFGIFATVITGTRGALIPILVVVATLPLIFWRKLPSKKVMLLACAAVVGIFLTAQHPTLDARIEQTQSSFRQISEDNWQTSVGIRLTMWRAGLSAAGEEPVIGAGYNFKEIFSNYQAPSPGLEAAASMIGAQFENFHSIYVDTLVRTGIVGLALLFAVFSCGLWSNTKGKHLLMLAPILGVAASGLFDSALELGITTSYLIIAGSILKAVDFEQSPAT